MRFLCISDIHGNVDALRATLEEGKHRDYHQLLVCGDLLYPGAQPLETWKILLEARAICVQGVSDRALAAVDPATLKPETDEQRERVRRLVEAKQEIGELIVARLARLEATVRLPLESGDELLLVHGAPSDPMEPITPDMSDEEVNALIADDPADVIVCGASHIPFHRELEELHVINVGSVGEAPGGGVAHATIIEANPLGVSIEQFEVRL